MPQPVVVAQGLAAMKCSECGFFPVHTKQYYAQFGHCLYRLMGLDCPRWIPPKYRKP